MGPTANQASDNDVYDLIFRKSYILHGDARARRKGGSLSHKTGEKADIHTEKGRLYYWTMNNATSNYEIKS